MDGLNAVYTRVLRRKTWAWKIAPGMEAVSCEKMDTPDNVVNTKLGKATGEWLCVCRMDEKSRKKVEKGGQNILQFDGACFII